LQKCAQSRIDGTGREGPGVCQPNVHASAEALRTLRYELGRARFGVSERAMSVRVREAAFASLRHFVHFSAVAQLTGRQSNLGSIGMAPQSSFEPITRWLNSYVFERYAFSSKETKVGRHRRTGFD
jgi:hypothetical protein